jgi:hypothetical protein
MTTTTQIRERIIILLSLAAFSLTFLCYRDSDSISALYVGVNSVRVNIVLAAVYCAGDN